MQPRDWFKLVVRLAGLGFLVCAAFDRCYAIVKALGFETPSKIPFSTDLVFTSCFVVLALGGLFGAEGLGNLCYGRRSG